MSGPLSAIIPGLLLACSGAALPGQEQPGSPQPAASPLAPTRPGHRAKLTPSDAEDALYFGPVMSGAGDVDGDGYDDLVVHASQHSSGSAVGAFYTYSGSWAGIDRSSERRHESPHESGVLTFSNSLSAAGDVDGDGYDDVVAGSWSVDEGLSHAGAAYVYYGSGEGLDDLDLTSILASDRASGDKLGLTVSTAGDVDDDGYDDVVISAPGYEGSSGEDGAVYLFHGSGDGIDLDSEDLLTALSPEEAEGFGGDVAGAGDTNGDGFSDIVVGAPSSYGKVYVYSGSPFGIRPDSQVELSSSDLSVGDGYGADVAAAGDTNGDGYDDVVVGAYHHDGAGTYAGAAYVYSGSSSGTDPRSELRLVASDAAERDYFGGALTGAQDLDGDGFDDIVIGAFGADATGAAYLYPGSADGVSTAGELRLQPARGIGAYFGCSVAMAGDVDGDGAGDLFIGAKLDNEGGRKAGAVHLSYGD